MQEPKEYDYMFKIILVGSSGVGKSNILLRYTRDQFKEDMQITIGVEYAHKMVTTSTGKKIKFQIWDTAGQQQYKAIMKAFYKGTSAAFLCYDITREKTHQDVQFWYQQLKEYSKSEIVIMLVGNKSDLEDQRNVTKQQGLQYAEEKKIAFYQVSAKDASNINLIFQKMGEELAKIMDEEQVRKSVMKPDQQPKKNFKINSQTQKQAVKDMKKDKKCCN